MSNPDEGFNLLNQDSPIKSNFYNKVIPNLPHSLNDLLEKAKNVESKLDTNKKGANEAGIENSEVNKNTNLKEKQKRDTKFFEFDNFRRVNNYIPKIHINKHREKESENINLPFYSEKEQNYKGIMSLFNEREMSPVNNNLFYNSNNFRLSNKKSEENTLIRNDIDYDYSLPPNFYTNRYVEYIYEDRGDKLYDENNELKNLLGRNQNKDNKNFIDINSPYLKAYNDLIEKEKEDVENENKEIYQNELQRGQEFVLSKTEQENITNFANSIKDLHKEKTSLENYFEFNLNKRNEHNLNNSINNIPENEDENAKENDKQDKKDKTKYTPDDISFDIDILGEITKKIRNSSKKSHPRGIELKGPTAKWYRQNEDNENLKLKGYFDIRNINFDETKSELQDKLLSRSSDIIDDDQEEYFTVRDVIEKGKVNKKDTVFTSKKIKEFGNKTFKYFFEQLKKYFTELLLNINKATYNILKFLSDTQITHLELINEQHKGLIDYIFWHPKLQELTIPSSFVDKLSQAMKSENWECKLTSLTIKKSISNVNDNNADIKLMEIFNLPTSLTIQNIHFIDMNYKQSFIEALFKHIDYFYSTNISQDEMKKSNLSLNFFEKLKLTKLPIVNLSWKRTPNPNDNGTKSEVGISLQAIYYLLMYMLIKSLGFNHGTIPEIFNKLDLSESYTYENSDYFLVKIITKFKIIKELDISNTRLSKEQKIFDLKSFLSQIKLTEKFEQTFDQKYYHDKYLSELMNKINGFRKNLKEKNEENSIQNIDEYEEDPSYDYSMGILPLLEKIYIYNTETKISDCDEIYALFRRLKFFRGIYYTEPIAKLNIENINNNFCDALVEKINKDKKTFCENVFIISNDIKV